MDGCGYFEDRRENAAGAHRDGHQHAEHPKRYPGRGSPEGRASGRDGRPGGNPCVRAAGRDVGSLRRGGCRCPERIRIHPSGARRCSGEESRDRSEAVFGHRRTLLSGGRRRCAQSGSSVHPKPGRTALGQPGVCKASPDFRLFQSERALPDGDADHKPRVPVPLPVLRVSAGDDRSEVSTALHRGCH